MNQRVCRKETHAMRGPLEFLDAWTARGHGRQTVLMWIVAVGTLAVVACAVAGMTWYTAPPPRG